MSVVGKCTQPVIGAAATCVQLSGMRHNIVRTRRWWPPLPAPLHACNDTVARQHCRIWTVVCTSSDMISINICIILA